MKTVPALILLALLSFWGIARADEAYVGNFDDIDKNKDKRIVKSEFIHFFKFKHSPEEVFDKIDTDKSGGIDRAEWDAFQKAQRQERKGNAQGTREKKQ